MDKDITIGSGRTIFKQGEKGGDLYFIKGGEVELLVRDEETGNEAVVAVLGAKTVIGTMSFLEGDPRSATARVKSELKCIKISQVQRDQMLKSVPSWLRILIKDLSVNLRRLNLEFINSKSQIKIIEKKHEVKVKQKEQLEKELQETQESLRMLTKQSKQRESELQQEISQKNDMIASLEEKIANQGK